MDSELLYKKYSLMMQDYFGNNIMTQFEFDAFLKEKLEGMHYVEIENGTQIGFLYYGAWDVDDIHNYIVLPYGYYAEDEKTMVKLFQKWSKEVVKTGKYEFSVNLYAKDTECIRAFHMMQFGNMSETGIKKLEDKDLHIEGFDIRVLTKEVISKNWEEVWKATQGIVSHLRTAPVFYPGTEFTEDIYKDYFLNDELELIAAYKNDKISGIIEWNKEEFEYFHGKANSVNVGEAFVYPEYRGTGIAEQLLRFAEKRALDEGYQYMWVEHGTANPNARNFWNKYFNTYKYELVRSIVNL